MPNVIILDPALDKPIAGFTSGEVIDGRWIEINGRLYDADWAFIAEKAETVKMSMDAFDKELSQKYSEIALLQKQITILSNDRKAMLEIWRERFGVRK